MLKSRFQMLPDNVSNRFAPKEEVDVYPDIVELMHRSMGSDGALITVQEFEGPIGVPDFVAVTHIRSEVAYRDFSALPLIENRADAVLLAAVPIGRSVTSATVARRLGIDESLVTQKVNRLVNSGHLLISGKGLVRHPLMVPFGRINAFEGKVKDWQAALSQAFRYSLWTDSSTACMLRLPEEQDGAANLASNLGVGLTLGSRWIVRPRSSRKNEGMRLFASELLLARMQNQIETLQI